MTGRRRPRQPKRPLETRGERLAWLAKHHPRRLAAMLNECIPAEMGRLDSDWESWTWPGQRPPEGDWRTWLIMAGRGFGKTRTGAEWVRGLARRRWKTRIALVGATAAEARAVMIEGPSGILAVSPPDERPLWEPSLGRLSWRSGAEAQVFSGENPEGLRGPEHDYAWCDELAKWARAAAAWDNLMLGLRRGTRPRALVTTTPRPSPILKRIMADEGTRKTGGRTSDNKHLPDAYLSAVTGMYGGTRLGRQELDGELFEEVEGALWSRALIERCRCGPVPELVRVVIGVDPPASTSGACGIVAVGLGEDGIGYVLGDHSVAGLTPDGWARAVAAAASCWGADRVIAEKNMGGDMVEGVLRGAAVNLPVRGVSASRGKIARAEPVQALYEQGKVRHAGAFAELEDQLCGMIVGGSYEGPGHSPDRADALVWALTELLLAPQRAEPRIILF